MKLPRLRWWVLAFLVAIFGSLLWSISIQPTLATIAYKQRWIERFLDYSGDGNIPGEWRDDVGRRTMPSGEWIMAAMYHGGCAPGREGAFNASVTLDSAGAIHTRDWSPCSDTVDSVVAYWEILEPSADLRSFYNQHPAWTKIRAARPSPQVR